LQVGTWRDLTGPVGDGDGARIPEGVGELLAEEGVAAGVLPNEVGDRLRHRGDSQPLPDERGDVVSRQGIELKPLAAGCLAEPLVFLGDGFGERAQGEDQQRAGELLGDEPGERPGGRVAPVSVFEHDQQRLVLGGRLERAGQEPAGVVGAYLPLKLADERILGEVEWQDVAEQRGQAL
jgi:hypothetical protein